MYKVIAATTLATLLLTTDVPPENEYHGYVDDYGKTLGIEGVSSAYEWTPDGPLAKPITLPPVKYTRAKAAICTLADGDTVIDGGNQMGGCTDGWVESVVRAPCEDGAYLLEALWAEHLQPDGTYGEPEFVSNGRCVSPADLTAEAQREFTSMHVPAPTATLQTGNPTTLLVNAWYPVYTTDDPMTHEATLLDVPVEIRAVPTQYTWDFDDPFSPTGATLTTTDPGRPWLDGDPAPDATWIAHAWTRLGDPATATGRNVGTTLTRGAKTRHDVTVTLTTTWHGQFRIAGTATWTAIPGELTTTSNAGTYTITEARTHLYCDDLDGNTTCPQ